MNLQAGQILADKYRILRQIGQGGMGSVYEGENIRIHRRVAIKTLNAHVAGKADVLQRFEREAQAAGRIGSDHIVEVLDLGDLPDGSRFMVMEFLEGGTLSDRIVRSGRLTPRDLVPILTQLLDGLEKAHQAGIIHRDLKPANVFLIQNRMQRMEFVKILDFGVSKFNVLSSDEMSMTRTGAVMGTPYYMSPEQAKGARAIDLRSDLYSVGVIIYEAVTGQVPFNAETFNELIFKIALESPPPPEHFAPNLDSAFGVLMRKAMARDPNERFQTATELKDAVHAWARDFDARVAAARAAPPHGPPGPQTQVLPIVGAMQTRGSSPALAPGANGQTQLVHATQNMEPAARKRSVLPVVVALSAALLFGGILALVFYGRSHVAQANPSSTASATASPPAAVSTAVAVASPPAEPSTTSVSLESLPEPSASEVASVSASAPDSAVGRPTMRPTNRLPPPPPPPHTTPTLAPPPPPPPTKPGGRDIRPDL